jgi:hypothetical protein
LKQSNNDQVSPTITMAGFRAANVSEWYFFYAKADGRVCLAAAVHGGDI